MPENQDAAEILPQPPKSPKPPASEKAGEPLVAEKLSKPPEVLDTPEPALEQIAEEIKETVKAVKENVEEGVSLKKALEPASGQIASSGLRILLDESHSDFGALPPRVQDAVREINNLIRYDPKAIDPHRLESLRGQIAGTRNVEDRVRKYLLEELARIEQPWRKQGVEFREAKARRIIQRSEVNAVGEGDFEFDRRFEEEEIQLLKEGGLEAEIEFFNTSHG